MEAIGILDKLIVLDKASATQHRIQKFGLLLHETQDSDAAYKEGAQVLSASWDDATMLNAVARFVLSKPDLERRDLKFAMKAVDRANRLTDGEEPAILDTLARIHYERGNVKQAIKWQKKAVVAGVGTPWETLIRQTLEKYESEAKN